MLPGLAHNTSSDGDGISASRPGNRSRGRLFLFVGMLVLFPFFVTVAYFATRSVLPEASMLRFAVSEGSSSFTQAQYFNVTSLQQVSGQLFPSLNSQSLASPFLVSPPTVDFVGILLVLAVAIAVVILWRGLRTRRVRTAPFEDTDNLLADQRRKLADILDGAVTRLNAGSAYRETVIRCYKLISELLEERSELDGSFLTAREFRERVTEKLKVESPYLNQLTELFEVARYSEREITADQSREAVACLSNLSEILKHPVLLVSDVK